MWGQSALDEGDSPSKPPREAPNKRKATPPLYNQFQGPNPLHSQSLLLVEMTLNHINNQLKKYYLLW